MIQSVLPGVHQDSRYDKGTHYTCYLPVRLATDIDGLDSIHRVHQGSRYDKGTHFTRHLLVLFADIDGLLGFTWCASRLKMCVILAIFQPAS